MNSLSPPPPRINQSRLKTSTDKLIQANSNNDRQISLPNVIDTSGNLLSGWHRFTGVRFLCLMPLIHGGNLLSGRHTIYGCQISLPNVIDTWRELAQRPAHDSGVRFLCLMSLIHGGNLLSGRHTIYGCQISLPNVIDTWRELAQRPAHDSGVGRRTLELAQEARIFRPEHSEKRNKNQLLYVTEQQKKRKRT